MAPFHEVLLTNNPLIYSDGGGITCAGLTFSPSLAVEFENVPIQ